MTVFRSFIIIISFFYCILKIAKAEETRFWQNPLPQGNDLNDVFIINNQTAIAVGDQGTILRTDNDGLNWDVEYHLEGISMNLVKIDFTDDQKGWILANDFSYVNDNSSIILESNDQGNTWNILLELDTLRLTDFFFLNADTGWAVGLSNILKTTDEGVSWQSQNTQGMGFISTIFFINPTEGWIGVDDKIYHTTNGGQTWSQIFASTFPDIFKKIFFTDKQKGWCVIERIHVPTGLIYIFIGKTMDGGHTWTFPLSIQENQTDVFFLNPDTGWVAANSQIFSTKDGGVNWYCWDGHSFPPLEKAKSLHFNNHLNGFTVGPYGSILKTNDAGDSWTSVSSIETTYDLNDIYFINSDTGWIAGEYGFPSREGWQCVSIIQKTVNGGISWSDPQEFGPAFAYYGFSSIQFVNENIGYVAGALGLFQSIDGGTNWNQIRNGSFSKVLFQNADTGFVSERKWPSKLYKTTNGGSHWNEVSYQTGPIEDIYFLNDSEGWTVGWNIPILHTTDGGSIWISISDSGWALNSVYFITPKIGWVTGGSQNHNPQFPGIIAKSTDGGHHWNMLYQTWDYKFNSVIFLDSLNGIVVGEEISESNWTNDKTGIILYTNDGGSTWNNYDGLVMKGLKNIFFNDNQTGWIVGAGGTILKTNSGGIVGFKKGQKIATDIPNSFQLYQNYPNPFNPSTTIEFDLPQAGFVSLKIYNILGEEVCTMVSKQFAAGNYKYVWDASNLASGLYFYRLETENFVQTKKLILVH